VVATGRARRSDRLTVALRTRDEPYYFFRRRLIPRRTGFSSDDGGCPDVRRDEAYRADVSHRGSSNRSTLWVSEKMTEESAHGGDCEELERCLSIR
jgi:hypothetical protein